MGVAPYHDTVLFNFVREFREEHDKFFDVDSPEPKYGEADCGSVRFYKILADPFNGLALDIVKGLQIFFVCNDWVDVAVPCYVHEAEFLKS